MRVLVVGAELDRCERFLFAQLAREGVGIHMLCPPGSATFAEFSALGLPTGAMRFAGRIDPAAVRQLRAVLHAGRYDIVHSLSNRTLSNSLLATQGRAPRHVAYRGTIGHLSRLDPMSWLTYLHPRIGRIVCVSDAVRRYLRSLGVPGARLRTIYKGHDVRWYDGLPSPPLADLGIPPDAFVVGFSGNMRPVKGVDVLIRSLDYLEDLPHMRLLLVGDVRDRAVLRLARQPRFQSRLRLTGFRSDAPGLMGRCHMCVMPSLEREGLPRAVIEAMAQGVPAVVSSVGGIPELVIDGVCGRVVPPRDPRALAEAIRTLATDAALRARCGIAARRRIEERFNIMDTCRSTLEMYAEMLAQP